MHLDNICAIYEDNLIEMQLVPMETLYKLEVNLWADVALS